MKLKTLAEKYGYTCYWCKKRFALEDLSRDHILTGIHKGKDGHRRKMGECVLACIFCNQKRGNKPFEVFQRELDQEQRDYHERMEKLWGMELLSNKKTYGRRH